ncbi:tripartite tricarboxylate transporter substrate binding protein [Siccirubricoccus phaeus]|uniref:tripartite tricarboxylate transporter substrate binding protein n=1 Tax=Siccirubricoccus phaeus TaxID=2595053 RepID=UPI0011F0A661|nr:tripartite tricarboxylate transporter substrate binding protein [Siccirubricoccus phaeus]
MTINRRALIAGAGAAIAPAWAPAALAQAYPARPVRLIAPILPGGVTDILARLFALRLTERMGQPVVVENRPGAGLIIGMEHVARSAPDGYTIIIASQGAMAVNASLFARLPYDTLRDFAPITQVVEFPVMLVVRPDFPAADINAFLAMARAQPGALTFGSAGIGTISHLGMELLKAQGNVDLTHVPFNGEAPPLQEVIAGRVSALLATFAVGMPAVRGGQVRAIGIASRRRSALAPEIPTLAETGFTDFSVTGWFGMLAPAGTPSAVVERLHGEFVAVLNEPQSRERLLALGVEPQGLESPAAFGRFIAEETARWREVVTRAGVRAG